MCKEYICNSADKTRREVLISVFDVLENENKLKELAGKNALLDCALCMAAETDPQYKIVLRKYISPEELKDDIDHIKKHTKIKNNLSKVRERYERI